MATAEKKTITHLLHNKSPLQLMSSACYMQAALLQ